MIKVPEVDITIVSIIGLVLIFVFSITIIRATRYIALKTVAETNRIWLTMIFYHILTIYLFIYDILISIHIIKITRDI